jgi:two-component system chemotaxis sensor kinase CheA
MERSPDAKSHVFALRGSPVPFLDVREVFDLPQAAPRRQNIVVVRHDDGLAGLIVDGLHGESQVVIKPLGKLFRRLPGVSGSTILEDGKVALILDVPALLRQAGPLLAETHPAG